MKLLIVSPSQFGYLIDYKEYFQYLKSDGHEVMYLCWRFKDRPLIDQDNPNIMYVSRDGGIIERNIRFIKTIIRLYKEIKFDKIFLNWFPGCSILNNLIPKKILYLDIRTVCVNPNNIKRRLFDSLVFWESKRFFNVSVIGKDCAEKIGIKRYKILPLGANRFIYHETDSVNSTFNFLYVGTLVNRHIIDCVRGFHSYLMKNPDQQAKLIIIGSGMESEEIKEYIITNNLSSSVSYLGYIPQSGLTHYFTIADCGISYIPLTSYFDVQPSTKTYEYLLNGIPIIATASKDNVRILSQSVVPCGILIQDNAGDFERAVSEIIRERSKYNKQAISSEFGQYAWGELLNKHLYNILDISQY